MPLAHKMVGFTMICLEIGQEMAAWTALRGDCILICFGLESSVGVKMGAKNVANGQISGRLYFVHLY